MNPGAPPHRHKKSLRAHARERVYEILELARPGDPLAAWARNALVILVLLSVLSVILETVPSIQASFGRWLDGFEILAVIMFTLEYAMRLWAAPDHPPWKRLPAWKARMRYVTTPAAIIDLLTVIPFYLAYFVAADFRVFVMFRLLRLLKLARYSPGMRSLSEAIYIERRALLACGLILLALVIGTASIMHMVEHEAQPDRFGTIRCDVVVHRDTDHSRLWRQRAHHAAGKSCGEPHRADGACDACIAGWHHCHLICASHSSSRFCGDMGHGGARAPVCVTITGRCFEHNALFACPSGATG